MKSKFSTARGVTPLEAAQLCDGAAGALANRSAEQSAGLRRDLLAYYLGAVDPAYRKLQATLKDLRKQECALVDPVAEIMVMKELPAERPTYLLKRGSYDARPAGSASSGALRRACPPLRILARATGSGWRNG